jgi:tetratricopeptide (TPR) repeat protein
VFAILACVWIGLNVHSGWIRYHEFLGGRAFERVHLADELALAQVNPARWLSPADRENIAQGKEHLQTASKFGLFVNSEALPKLAWFEYLLGNTEQAVDLLGQAATYQTGQGKALSLYYRGAILNRLGRYDQAQASLDEALTERDDLILARQEKGESLWQLGRKDEAISVWLDALQRNPRLALVNYELAGAMQSLGKVEEGSSYERQGDRFTPNDPLFHWMIGSRLQELGMTELAQKHVERANQLDPGNESGNQR